MADNLNLGLTITADDQASPDIAKLTEEIDRLTAQVNAQKPAVQGSSKDWLDYAQQTTATANSAAGLISSIEDIVIKTAEIGAAITVYQKWRALVEGLKDSYLGLQVLLAQSKATGSALLDAGWAEAELQAARLETTVGRLVARFLEYSRIGAVLKGAGIGLTLVEIGVEANTANEKTRALTEQIGGLSQSLQQLDPASQSVKNAKERFEELYKASLALKTSTDDLLPAYKAFFDQTASSNLTVKQSADILTDLAKTHRALRVTTDESVAGFSALNAAFESGFTSVSQLKTIFGAALNPALDATAQQMGLTRQQLQELINTGRLGAQDILPALTASANHLTTPLQTAGDAAEFSKKQFQDMGLSVFDLANQKLPGVDNALQHTAKEIANTADSSVDPIGAAVERIVNFGAQVVDWARRVKLSITEAFTTADWTQDWKTGIQEAVYGLDYLLVGLKEEFNAVGESIGIVAGAATTATNPLDDLSAAWAGMQDRLLNTRDRLNEYVNALEGVDNASGRMAEGAKAATEALKTLKEVPLPEALQKIVDKLDSAHSASKAVSEVWAQLGTLDFTSNNLKNLGILINTIDEVSKATRDATGTQQAFSQQLAELPTDRLITLLGKVQSLKDQLEASGNQGVLMGTVLGAVFEKLGINATEAGGQVTKYGKDGAAAFAAIATAAETSGAQIRAALDAALSGAKTLSDVAAIKAAFDALAASGQASAQLIADGQAAIARRLAEVQTQVSGVQQGFKTLGVESVAHLQALAEAAKASFAQLSYGNAALIDVQKGFLAWADAEIKAANATGTAVSAQVRHKAETLGLTDALNALIAKHRELTPELQANIDKTSAVASAQHSYLSALQSVATAQIDGYKNEIALAQAKGYTWTAQQKSIELTQLETQWQETIAAATQKVIAADIASEQAKLLAKQAIVDKKDADYAEIAAIQLKLQALGLEAQAQAIAGQVAAQRLQQQQLNAGQQQQNTKDTQQNTEATQQNTKAEQQNNAEKGSAWSLTKLMGDALGYARDQMEKLSPATKALFEQLVETKIVAAGFTSAYQTMIQSFQTELDPFAALRQSIKQFDATIAEARANALFAAHDVGGFFAAIKAASAEAGKAYTEQKLSAEELAASLHRMADGGRVDLGTLQIATQGAAGEFNLLNQTDLKDLQSAIDSTNQKLKAMQDEATSAQDKLAELNAEIAQERGDTATADKLKLELEQRQALAEAEAKLAQAQKEHNQELIDLYQQQIDKLNDLYALKEKNLEQDQRTKTNTANTTNSNTTSGGSSSGAGTSGAGGKVYTLNLTSGGKTLTANTNTDPSAFLDALAQARSRSLS